MPSDNESDRIKEVKIKIKEDAEITKLQYEAEIEAIKARFKHELRKQIIMQGAFEEICSEMLKNKAPEDFTDEEKKNYDRLTKIFDRLAGEDYETFDIFINDIDSGLIDDIKPEAHFIIEIDRQNKKFILREEKVEGSYAYIEAEIVDYIKKP
jgi:hypothetical protein